MDTRDLYYFQAVAECGHMGMAAQRLFLTQPALTKAVHRLEEEIGSPLLKRNGRRIALTDLGELLLERTRHVRQVMDDTAREVKNFAGGLVGHIRIGCAPTVAKYLLPEIVPVLFAEAPGVTLELDTAMSDILWEQLRDGFLDLAVTQISEMEDGFTVLPVIDDDVVVVAGKDHPIFTAAYTVHDLERYDWILPKSSVQTRPWLDAALKKNGCPPPKARMQAATILHLPRLIAETDLLSFISRRNIGALEDGALLREVRIPETTLHRTFSLAYRNNRYRSPAVQRLIRLIQEYGAMPRSF